MGLSVLGIITGVIDLGHAEFYAIIAGMCVSVATLLITIQYRRKNMRVMGITNITSAIDGGNFRNASNKLYGKYFENKDISESDLQKAAEQVRSDLMVIQGLIESRMVNTKRVFGTYSDVIMYTLDSYKKFLEEFEPQDSDLDAPIQRIYDTSLQWIKEKKLIKKVT